VGIVQLMLVGSFAFIPALYAGLMPRYEQAAFVRLVWVGMAGAALFWIVSVLGEERRALAAARVQAAVGPRPSFRAAFGALWSDHRARRYMVFLAASAFFAFMQDAMLEPFGGDVFKLAAGETTRFNAYWGAGVLVGMVGTLIATRRRRPDQQVNTTAWGLALLGTPLLLLGVVALREALPLVRPTLVFFGLGFGIFTVGGVSLLMAVNREEEAGTYLALWSVVQLVSRGAGIAAGGIVRDVALALSGEFRVAYASVFIIEAVGLFVAIWLLRRVDVSTFARRAHHSAVEALAAAE
jgi:MFS transporter, BCD family, chlorophyll transporter